MIIGQKKADLGLFIVALVERQKLTPTIIVQISERLNNSAKERQIFFFTMSSLFHECPSKKILFAVQILQTMVKNCNRNFHIAASSDTQFQGQLMHLLRRQRGLQSMYQRLKSNKENWTKIQAKVLYLYQLWYDAFMLEQKTIANTIKNYRRLRQQGIIFPPRQQNQKNMLAIKTNSPIFDNIQEIAAHDQINFTRKKAGLGLINNQKQKFKQTNSQKVKMNLQQVGELIAIIRSLDSNIHSTKQAYHKLKNIVTNQIVSSADKKDSYQLLQEADKVIQEWDVKYGQNIQASQEQYMKKKMSSMMRSKIQEMQPDTKKQEEKQQIDLLG